MLELLPNAGQQAIGLLGRELVIACLFAGMAQVAFGRGLDAGQLHPHLIQLGGRSVEGLVVSQLFARDDARPRFQAFRTAFRARFNQEPGFVAVAAYDATCAALTAYAKRAPGASLKATLLSIPAFEGVQQTWSFDAQGDATRQVSVARVHDGRFVALEDRFP